MTGRPTTDRTPPGDAPALRIDGLSVSYGGISAVRELTVQVGPGELVGLVGPNGAGKTSVLRAVMGAEPAAAGSVHVHGADLTNRGVETTVRAGVRLVPEGRRILGTLTVEENLLLGATGRRDIAAVTDDLRRLCERFPILGSRADQPAGQLSGGEQQMLAIARALMARPRLLLLDEPTLGLAPLIVGAVFDVVSELRAEELSILLVEQNVFQTIRTADRTYVLSNGEIVLEGTADELADRHDVVDSYLGG